MWEREGGEINLFTSYHRFYNRDEVHLNVFVVSELFFLNGDECIFIVNVEFFAKKSNETFKIY